MRIAAAARSRRREGAVVQLMSPQTAEALDRNRQAMVAAWDQEDGILRHGARGSLALEAW